MKNVEKNIQQDIVSIKLKKQINVQNVKKEYLNKKDAIHIGLIN